MHLLLLIKFFLFLASIDAKEICIIVIYGSLDGDAGRKWGAYVG